MRWIQSAVVVYLVVALGFTPAWAVVVNFGTFEGYQDTPQHATPVAFITLKMHHSNGKHYTATTDARGVARVDIPPGTITYCQAYSEDELIASWACKIPVGEKAVKVALKDAKTQTEEDTPIAIDSNPRAVTALGKNDGSLIFLGFNSLEQLYFTVAVVLIARYLTLIKNTWSITHDYLLTTFMATTVTAWVLVFFGQFSGRMSGGSIADQGTQAAD